MRGGLSKAYAVTAARRNGHGSGTADPGATPASHSNVRRASAGRIDGAALQPHSVGRSIRPLEKAASNPSTHRGARQPQSAASEEVSE